MASTRRETTAGARSGPLADEPLAIELIGIEKHFGGVQALRGADLRVRRGEILGLCGENGAGKSTLIKVISGAHAHESYRGSVAVFGHQQHFRSPVDAQRAGVAVVHQELMLVPELSVAENLLLGREPRHFGLVDDARVESVARAEVERFGFAERIDPVRRVGELGIGLQQAIEIIRALSQNAKILILDEPSAALTGAETEDLLRWLRRLRSEGTTCIYVSHRLPELFALCDRITVLRDGRHVATVEARASSPDEVISLMVGRSLHITARKVPSARAKEVPSFELEGFGVYRPRLRGEQGVRYAVQGVSLALGAGDIVGLCGAVGSGRTALLSAIFGGAKAGTVGTLRVGGRAVNITCPSDAIALGLAFVPEDRKGSGLVAEMTLAENLALPSLGSQKVMGRAAALGLVDPCAEARLAERGIKRLQIRGAATAPVSRLSGGNQQKVVLGKWLDEPPRVLLLDEPTRGVDVGAREEIYGILERLAEQGIAVLFASSDLTEVLRLAQRVIVLRQGRVTGVLDGDSLVEAEIVRLSTGANAQPYDIHPSEKGQPGS